MVHTSSSLTLNMDNNLSGTNEYKPEKQNGLLKAEQS